MCTLLLGPPASLKHGLDVHAGQVMRVQEFLGQHDLLDLNVGEAVLSNLEEYLATYAVKAKSHALAEWKAWLLQSIDQGARRAHQHVRGGQPWTPTTTLSREVAVISDPLALLGSEA
eukprot:4276597-Pyramimonas_sp.AAC.1